MSEAANDTIRVVVCVNMMRGPRGKCCGLSGSLGSGATQVFGGRGSANFMTRLTGVVAAIFMLTSASLAYLSSAGDREMKAFDVLQADR